MVVREKGELVSDSFGTVEKIAFGLCDSDRTRERERESERVR
jgi:hypothetical protein